MYLITLDHKKATLQQLHKNEGWTWKAEDIERTGIGEDCYITARTKKACIEAYDNILGIAWSQKQNNVRCVKKPVY